MVCVYESFKYALKDLSAGSLLLALGSVAGFKELVLPYFIFLAPNCLIWHQNVLAVVK